MARDPLETKYEVYVNNRLQLESFTVEEARAESAWWLRRGTGTEIVEVTRKLLVATHPNVGADTDA